MKGSESALSRRRFVGGSAIALVGPASLSACKGDKPPQRGVESASRGGQGGTGARSLTHGPTKTGGKSAPAFAELAAILPAEVDGYGPEGNDGHYDSNTLFELINGGAEVFLALNVRAVVSRRYSKPGAPELIVDIFDMGSASDAYGAYHHDMREGQSAGLGHESELGGSSLFFWKDRYYVSVVAFADTSKSRDAVVTVGRAVASRIKALGAIPALIATLPPQGLVTSQVHYFHTWPLLKHHFQFTGEDLLGLGKDTEGVLARYRQGDAARMQSILLIQYPSAERAEGAQRRFVAGYLSGAAAEISQTANGWVGFRRRDNELIGVFDASSADQVGALLSAIERQRKGEE